jgi:plasmid stability protein
MDDLGILAVRRIEANIIRPIYEELEWRLGEAQAREILAAAIERDAVRQGAALAASTEAPKDLATFAQLLAPWSQGGALVKDDLHVSPERLDFNVTRCRYAETYAEMGLAHIGAILSCGRDGAMCTGYNPQVELTRTQTIMAGATHCDFRFRLVAAPSGEV